VTTRASIASNLRAGASQVMHALCQLS